MPTASANAAASLAGALRAQAEARLRALGALTGEAMMEVTGDSFASARARYREAGLLMALTDDDDD